MRNIHPMNVVKAVKESSSKQGHLGIILFLILSMVALLLPCSLSFAQAHVTTIWQTDLPEVEFTDRSTCASNCNATRKEYS